MAQQRRHFDGTQKVAILKEHLVEKVPVSTLCDKHDIYPTQFYAWLKEFFENGHAAFDSGRNSKAEGDAKDRKVEALEAKLTRKNEVLAELMEEHTQLKKSWGDQTGRWVPHVTRDTVVDFVREWSDKTDLPACRLLAWIAISTSKFHDWKQRFGKVNEHNALVPRDHWLTDDEKEQIRTFARGHPLEGYRRLTFMMLDADVVACSPASVYRVLKAAGLLAGSSPVPSKKGTGFIQPLTPHEHWHIDVSYLNIAGEERAAFVLSKPREALRQTQGMRAALGDPRLSRAGNWLVRQLTQASETLVRLEHWLRTPGPEPGFCRPKRRGEKPSDPKYRASGVHAGPQGPLHHQRQIAGGSDGRPGGSNDPQPRPLLRAFRYC